MPNEVLKKLVREGRRTSLATAALRLANIAIRALALNTRLIIRALNMIHKNKMSKTRLTTATSTFMRFFKPYSRATVADTDTYERGISTDVSYL